MQQPKNGTESSTSNPTFIKIRGKRVTIQEPVVDRSRIQSKTEDPRRVKFGKASTFTILRDMIIFFSIVGVLLFFTLHSDSKGKENKPKTVHPEKLVSQELKKIRDAFDRDIWEKFENTKRRDPCYSFLDHSSIPGAGLTVFAGRDYKEGDVVLKVDFLVPWRTGDQNASYVSPLALLLKHHPLLSNVEGKVVASDPSEPLVEFALRATRPIEAGDELFFAFDKHPHSILGDGRFSHILTEREYNVADAIIRDSEATANRMAVGHRKGRLCNIDTSYVIGVARRTAALFDVRVASLLPQTKNDHEQRQKQASSTAALQNKTLMQLRVQATCLGDVETNTINDDVALFATRRMEEGDIVLPVPMYIFNQATLNRSPEQTCETDSYSTISNCISINSRIKFCPLTPLLLASATTTNSYNAELRWKRKEEEYLTDEELMNIPIGNVVWNLVATKQIDYGEKISVQANEGVPFLYPSQ